MVDGQAPCLLAPHVHLCVCGRRVVLMDWRPDRYVAVRPGHLLAGWVSGWPGTETPAEPPTPAGWQTAPRGRGIEVRCTGLRGGSCALYRLGGSQGVVLGRLFARRAGGSTPA